MRALWLAFCDKKISEYIRDWNETSDWFSFLPQRHLFWECLQMIKACLYTIHSERKYSLLAALAAIKTAVSSQQSQGSICGEIRLGTLLAFQCLAVRPDWVRLREAREKTNSCRLLRCGSRGGAIGHAEWAKTRICWIRWFKTLTLGGGRDSSQASGALLKREIKKTNHWNDSGFQSLEIGDSIIRSPINRLFSKWYCHSWLSI